MDKFEKLEEKIDESRRIMNELILEKTNLCDPEVVIASQLLDKVLDEYYKILKNSKNK